MYQLSKELRRSTEDVDIDIVRLSITDKSLIKLLNQIGKIDTNDGIFFTVIESPIEVLKHENYEGKRVILLFKDKYGNSLKLKLDIGVHTNFDIRQSSIIFDLVTSDKGIQLLANPVEQIIVEKTSSFIRYGVFSTRMKDLYDIFYLINNHKYSINTINEIIDFLFIKDEQIKSIEQYVDIMKELLQSDLLINNFKRSDNWTGYDTHLIITKLIDFFQTILI